MTEQDWLAARSPHELLHVVRERASDRKLRLFACACCRPLVGRVPRVGGERRVTAAERFADGLCSEEKFLSHFPPRPRLTGQRLRGAAQLAFDALGWPPAEQPNWVLDEETHEPVRRPWEPGGYAEHFTNRVCLHAAHALALLSPDGVFPERMAAVAADQAVLFRDVFGNQFRPVAFDPAWRSDNAVSLAKGVYESRDWTVLPILADAFEDAGCDDGQVLTHCRDPHQVHARGCWAVDLVLGRE